MSHCCQSRHYSFDILKCGSSACEFCKPPRLPQEVFRKVHHLPDPVIGDDHHYLLFEEVFGTDTTEKDTLSAQKSKDGGRKFTLKHVKNANIMLMLMLMCDECSLWRLLYSCNKLTTEERQKFKTNLAVSHLHVGLPLKISMLIYRCIHETCTALNLSRSSTTVRVMNRFVSIVPQKKI